MNSELRQRMLHMEISPPAGVWSLIDRELDEINGDNVIAGKLYDAEISPGRSAWESISDSLEKPMVPTGRRKYKPVLRYLAAAAITVGIVFSLWLVFRHSPSDAPQNASVRSAKNQQTLTQDSSHELNTPTEGNPVLEPGSEPGNPSKGTALVKVSAAKHAVAVENRNGFEPLRDEESHPEPLVMAIAEDLPRKPEFDDLSLVAADDQYMTMMNANGRLVKIPVQLAHLAPRFQNKPFDENFYEIMFNEGSYWKETFDLWRQNLATNPSMNGDVFSSVIALLKSVED